MKKCWILTVLLMLLAGCAHAQTAALPEDTRVYVEKLAEDGAVVLESMDRSIPAGTLCTLEEMAQTDESCSLTSMVRPFHRFARVSYSDERGEKQEDWIMLHALNRAVTQKLETSDQAQAYARRFFSNQYVMAADEKSNIIHELQGDEWRAEIRDEKGNAAHFVTFDRLGRVAQYRDLSFELPDIRGGEAYSEELSVAADESGAMAALEWISKELFPDAGFNSVPCYFHDEAQDAYTFFVDTFDYYITVQAGPQPRLLAYGDFRLDAGGYPGCLTHTQAVQKGMEAIRESFALAEDAQVDASQASFYISEPAWIGEDASAARWEIVLRIFSQDMMGEFWVGIDALTGEMIPAEPEQGNG